MVLSYIITGAVCMFLGHLAGRRNRKPLSVYQISVGPTLDIKKFTKHIDKYIKANKK